jgi:hypothetical protein
VDITSGVVSSWSVKWGRFSEFSEAGAGTAELTLDNSSGDWDPDNSTGPNYGNLIAGAWFRILGGTTTANTDVFYGHVSDEGFQLEASQFPDSYVTVHLVDDMEQLSNTDEPGSVYEIEVLADSPRAWWRLGEGSGTVAVDSSGNDRNLTYVGGATFNSRAGLIDGDADNGIGFDGTDDYAISDTTIGFSGSGSLTIEAWIETSAGGTIFDQVGAPYAADIERAAPFVATNGSNIRFGGIGDDTLDSSGVDLLDGTIHHVVCVRDATTTYIYLDGALNASRANTENTIVQQAVTLAGFANTLGSGLFNGTLDEVAIYDSALSSARVAAHYAAGTSPWTSELTGARITHLLDAVAVPSTLRVIGTGSSTVRAANLAGGDAASAIRAVAKAEGGFVYVDHQNGGKLTFVDRHTRWTATASVTSQATFGDTGTDVTYDAVKLEDDRIINVASVQRANGATVTVTDATSSGARRRTYSESGLLFETDAESQYRAERIVAEKKDRHRVPRTITLRPRKSTHSAWAHVFARKVNDRITVKWHPTYGGTRQYDAWIDGIEHRWSVRDGLTTTFYLSPVPYDTTVEPYWIAGVSTAGVTTRPGY